MHLFSHKLLKKSAALLLSGLLSFGMTAQALAVSPVNIDPELGVSTSSGNTISTPSVSKIALAQTTDSIALDGTVVKPQAYKIGGENYFRLRDVAYLLRDTDSKFAVQWDASAGCIRLTTGQSYVGVGGELTAASGSSAVQSTAAVLVDDKAVDLTAYNVSGSNYFRLRDISQQIGFAVDYSSSTGTVQLASVSYYKVTFKMNGYGEQLGPITTAKKGGKISQPKVAAVSGHALVGWYTDSTLKKQWDFSSDTITKSMVLYAKWVSAYTVEFEMNGHGTQVATKKNVAQGSLIESPTPTDNYYIFGGWYKERTCNTAWNFSSDKVTANTILYAKWTPKYDDTTTTPTTGSTDTSTSGKSRIDGKLTILIDAGHGGSDYGAASVQAGVYEKTLNLKVALKLQTMLQADGVTVLMTRTSDDTYLPADKRTPYITNNAKTLDLIVCIHHNSVDGSPSAKGAEMLMQKGTTVNAAENKALATLFLQQYIALGCPNRGIAEQNLYMGRAAAAAGVPLAFSEFCFLSNTSDFARVSTDAGLQAQAQAMYNAITTYYQTAAY